MLIVRKYGGTSVGDADRIRHVARKLAAAWREGNELVVVLSAMGKTTDELIAKAKEIAPDASKREMDMLLSTGEQISVALCAMALGELGVPAISLNAFQVRMHTTSAYGNARFKKIDTERIRHELEAKKVVLVTGFQGVNKYDDVTTLGRGGSDTTAVALAAALQADLCEIYTDVDGIYTADPRIVPTARKLDEITYDEMLNLATLGAGVLHNRSVELAKKYGIPLVLRSSLSDAEGTVLKEEVKVERMLVSGVALDKTVDRVSVAGIPDRPGSAFRLFDLLARNRINIDVIVQSAGHDGKQEISFTIAEADAQTVEKLLSENRKKLGFDSFVIDRDIAKVSIVGAGMISHPGIASKVFEALFNVGVNIEMITTSEIRISVIIAKDQADRACRAVHDMFITED